MDLEKSLEEMNLSNDEIERLSNALKNEEFRKLLTEYAEEISDPVNRARYEEEIAQMEAERGMDVQFVNPEPGYVLKTSANGCIKTFINVCKNDLIAKPSGSKKIGPDGKPGFQWSIPHSFAPVRDDVDKDGNPSKVIDFVVHPETYRMAETNVPFKNMLHDTAFDGIEKQFDLKLDRKNKRFPKMDFKGTPSPTVIRSRKEGTSKTEVDKNDLLGSVNYPYGDKTTQELSEEREKKIEEERKHKPDDNNPSSGGERTEYETPIYNIIHRGYFDIQDYRKAPDAKATLRPKELVVEIDLPLLKSSANVDLDVLERSLSLTSEKGAKYKLDIKLPYPVDEEKGSAKFDKMRRRLIICLPVTHEPLQPISSDNIENENEDQDLDMKMPSSVDGDKPLIEVIASEENMNREGNQEHSGEDSPGILEENDDTKSVKEVVDSDCLRESTKTETVVKEKYFTFPQFDYLQDDETVTVIFEIKNGVRETLNKQYMKHEGKCNGVEITIESVGSGGFPIDFKAGVKFPDSCFVDDKNSYVDVGQHNVVVTLIKKDECIGPWQKVFIGESEDSCEERLFLSAESVKDDLDRLDTELAARQPFNRDVMPDLEVADMNKDQLTVNVKAKTGLRRSVSESGEEIEVVHEKQTPTTRSILKKRTMSESSDEVMTPGSYIKQYSSGSPISESDENGDSMSGGDNGSRTRKKSVSFDDRVEKATFKGHQSVKEMHQTLKNKRKRAKKHEKHAQKNRRRRNTNSFSEHSSDDAKDDSEAAKLAEAETTEVAESESKPVEGAAAKPKAKIASVNGNGKEVKQNGIENDKTVANDQKSSANHKNGNGSSKNKKKGKSKGTYAAEKNGSREKQNSTVKSSGSGKMQDNDKEDSTSSDASPVATNGVQNNGDIVQENEDENRTKVDYDSDDYHENEKVAEDENKVTQVKDKDAPETLLSWQDNAPIPDELKPQCAVSLSNTVMFDLDVE